MKHLEDEQKSNNTTGEIMAEEKLGIKETKEALHGILVLGAFVASRAKDGLKADDGLALVQKLMSDDEEFKKALSDAVDGIGQVPAEVKDLDVQEGLDLIIGAAPDILKIVDALK